MTSLLAFILALAILIVVHEWGHYRVARACRVKVLRFSVGFGPVLWRYQAHADTTEFVLCLIPLGGYVRMLDERDDPAIDAALLPQSFNRKSLRQRVAIVVAGPLANLLLAVFLFAAVAWMGTSEPRALLGTPVPGSLAEKAGQRSGDEVLACAVDGGQDWQGLDSYSQLQWQLLDALSDGRDLRLQVRHAQSGVRELTLPLDILAKREPSPEVLRQVGLGLPFSRPRIGEVTQGGPAQLAGLRRGDLLLRIDGAAVQDAAQARDWVRRSAGQTLHLQVDRDGRLLELRVQPRTVTGDDQQRQGRIDAVLGEPPERITVQRGAFDGLAHGFARTWDLSVMTVTTLGRMVVGQASVQQLSGPVTMADFAGQAARSGGIEFLTFLALISVSLGVFNLLPLPMLDGGHLMYYLFEGLSGRPVSLWWQRQLQRAGMALLLLVMSLALSNDLTRYLGLQ
ncbi:RIP metalloprotease RseP [Roseateles sp. BYS180W]|uniref:Zinc metalloprotease n=1 Tax=Roseateles rivi TaxID=3299028 RepID=A0ABW7FVS1_9BURK